MKNVHFLLSIILVSTLTGCNNSSSDDKPASPPPASAKEAIISVDKSLQTLAPDCAVKISEEAKGVELKEYTAMFNCNTSDSKVSSGQLKKLEQRLASLLSTIVVAKRSSLDTNQLNYVDAIEKETNMSIYSIRNSITSSERNDKAATAKIVAFQKKWDCELQNVPVEKWPFHMLNAMAGKCKKINLASYASIYELKKEFSEDIDRLDSYSSLRPDSIPAMFGNQIKVDFVSIFNEVKKLHIESINQNLPEYITGYSYTKRIVIDSVPLEIARENPRMLEKIILVQEFFKNDLKIRKEDSRFYKLLQNKIEEIHFVSNQAAPYEIGFTVSSGSCTTQKTSGSPGYFCPNTDNYVRIKAEYNYPNKEFGTLRVSLKNENLATAHLTSALVEVEKLTNDAFAPTNFSDLSTASYSLKNAVKKMPNVEVTFKALNGHVGGSIMQFKNVISRVQASVKDKQFNDTIPKSKKIAKYYVLFNFDLDTPEQVLPDYDETYSEYVVTIIIHISDSEEIIAAKLNPYLVPVIQ